MALAERGKVELKAPDNCNGKPIGNDVQVEGSSLFPRDYMQRFDKIALGTIRNVFRMERTRTDDIHCRARGVETDITSVSGVMDAVSGV